MMTHHPTLTARRPGRAGFLTLGLAVLLAACGSPQAQPGLTATGGDLPEVLATVGGESITLADLRDRIGDNLDAMESQYLRNRATLVDGALRELLRERVLDAEAARTGKSLEELVVAEAGATLDPTPIEVSTWYQDNQARLGGRSLDDLRSQIEDYLRSERRTKAVQDLEARLYREGKVEIFLEPYRLAFNNEGAPAKGPANAPVTMVEFSDFECPFCARFYPTLYQVAERYGDQVRVVYRQYPIPSIHPFAMKAAEASLCAHEQGKFWELHDLMFQDQKGLDIAGLKAKARRLGLNQSRFDSCLDSGKYAGQVQEDMREASRAGVNGTPAIFINGVQVPGGAVPFETVAAAIDRELARVKE